MGKARRYIWQAVLILYIAFIFSNSLTPAARSSAESGFVMAKIHALLGAIGMRDVSWLTEHLIRKGAHFTEDTLMGILLFRSMKTLDCGKIVIVRKIHEAAVFITPFVDETLQLFTEGRSGQISDVWLDMCGVAAGLCISWVTVQIGVRLHRAGRAKRSGRGLTGGWI